MEFKGKGNHSVNELESICLDYKEKYRCLRALYELDIIENVFVVKECEDGS